ncbi:Sec-independent protein translocase protein TATC chloroplastic [Bienertia sinuspersici]
MGFVLGMGKGLSLGLGMGWGWARGWGWSCGWTRAWGWARFFLGSGVGDGLGFGASLRRKLIRWRILVSKRMSYNLYSKKVMKAKEATFILGQLPQQQLSSGKMPRPLGVKAGKKRKEREENYVKEEEEVEMVKEYLPAATDATVEDDLPDIPIAVSGQNNRFKVVNLKMLTKMANRLYDFLYPSKDELPDDKAMTIFDHLEELQQRLFVARCSFSAISSWRVLLHNVEEHKLVFPLNNEFPIIMILRLGSAVYAYRYCSLLLRSLIILYEIIAFSVPSLTRAERRFLGPIVLGSFVLFYASITFSYFVLTPAALTFFVNYAEGAVESLWLIDQYFEFVLILMFSTGFSFQTCCYMTPLSSALHEGSYTVY